MSRIQRAFRAIGLALGVALAMVGCASGTRAPVVVGAPPSMTIESDPASPAAALAGRLGRGAAEGDSSVVLLESGIDALAARLTLIEQATRGIDLQVYIFRTDASGALLTEALRRAADRGVRVRLLLDDWGARPNDEQLQALAAHPRVEVRLFNPLVTPRAPILALLLDFDRANRRMHNKLMVADGRLGVMGGRNVGDEYFARRGGLAFGDLDVLLAGPAVAQAAAGFDAYWNDVSTVQVSPAGVIAMPEPADHRELASALSAARWLERLLQGEIHRFHGPARALHDMPGKVDPGRAGAAGDLGREIAAVMGEVRQDLLLVSPYFVPGEGGVAQLRALRERGVRVTVVTNSLAATDVPAVHSGYARHRRALLEAGVALYEIRPDAPQRRSVARTGSSRLSLHAKVMVVDGRSSFVGSMNIDPRSLRLNTENGLVMSSAGLAQVVHEGLRQALSASAYRVELDGQGRLRWHWQATDGEAQAAVAEPGASLWLRLQVRLLSWLPIDALL